MLQKTHKVCKEGQGVLFIFGSSDTDWQEGANKLFSIHDTRIYLSRDAKSTSSLRTGFLSENNLLSYISSSILFLSSLHMVNILREQRNYAPNIRYVLFFFLPSPGSQLVSSHLNAMSNSYTFVLWVFFSFYAYKSHNFSAFSDEDCTSR